MQKAVFFDRDHTLNPDPGYIGKPEDFDFYPYVFEGLKRLKDQGFLLILVSNQSGIGRGLFSEFDLLKVHEKFQLLLQVNAGFVFDDFYYCPHHPDDRCACRKPSPLLLMQAKEKHQIDLSKSYMVGDRDSDVVCGQQAGVKKSFQILPGNSNSFSGVVDEILTDSSS